MKIFLGTLFFVATVLGISCRKKFEENYSTTNDFFAKNGVAMQSYVINGSSGGSFTTPQGTIVTIPSNAFKTQSGNPVTSDVTIMFKDIYKKSDMLLSNKGTNTIWGTPLKSGGEFFIKCQLDNSTLVLNQGKHIDVQQPVSLTNGLDTVNKLQPFIQLDSMDFVGWVPSNDSLSNVVGYYIFSLYEFDTPVDSGSWCNSDNASFFNMYPSTKLTLHQLDNPTTEYGTQVFLVFKNIPSMVHVYATGNNNFLYSYAPQGLECTLVAFGVKDNRLYSSFIPIKITTNLTVDFSLNQTTTDEFISSLRTLD